MRKVFTSTTSEQQTYIYVYLGQVELVLNYRNGKNDILEQNHIRWKIFNIPVDYKPNQIILFTPSAKQIRRQFLRSYNKDSFAWIVFKRNICLPLNWMRYKNSCLYYEQCRYSYLYWLKNNEPTSRKSFAYMPKQNT